MLKTLLFTGTAALALAAGTPSADAWTVVSHTSAASGSGGSTFSTPAINTTGADLIVVVESYWAARTAGTLSDSAGNTFTLATQQNNPSAAAAGAIYFVHAPTTGTSDTFTLTNSSNFFASMEVFAVSGSGASPLDQTNGASETTGLTSLQTGSITPTQNNELIIAGLAMSDTSAAYAVDSGLTISDSVVYSSNNEGGALGYLAQGTAAAINPKFTWTGGAPGGVAMVASFKGAAAAGPSIDMSDNSHVAPGANGTFLGVVNGAWTSGQTGPVGPAGTNGNTVWNGTGAPAAATGVNGDFYIDTAADKIYGPKASGAWPSSGVSLVGPTGATGAQGPAGQNAGQNTYPACPAPTASSTVGNSMFCSANGHTDIAVSPAANTWVYFGPASATAP